MNTGLVLAHEGVPTISLPVSHPPDIAGADIAALDNGIVGISEGSGFFKGAGLCGLGRPEVHSCGLGQSCLTAGKAGKTSRQLLRGSRKLRTRHSMFETKQCFDKSSRYFTSTYSMSKFRGWIL
ncbi:hypothetical protein AMECASPLE_018293 [Ameca splendens]|uniref:Uncharacterized protein n=1 Tax=Ameca splendens TaxID=208324 RepID=A0ABV0Z1I6_9TELE